MNIKRYVAQGDLSTLYLYHSLPQTRTQVILLLPITHTHTHSLSLSLSLFLSLFLSFSLFLLSLFSLSFFSVPLTLYIYIPSCNALPKWFQKFIVVRYKVLGLDYRMNIKYLLPHHHLWSHKSTYISRNRCWLHEVHYIHMHTYISRNRCKHREIFTDIRYIHEYVHRYTCTHIYMCVNVYVCIHIPLREAEGEQRLCAGLGYLLSSS